MRLFRNKRAQHGLFVVACLLTLAGGAAAQSAADYNNLGIEAYNAGRNDEAIGYFEQALRDVSGNETVRRNLCNAHQAAANALAKGADFAGAAEHLERAIGIDATNHSPLVQLGSYYLRLDMVPDAIFRLEEAIELKPGDLDAHELLGKAYYEDNDLPSARAQWDYVLEIDPKRPGLQELYEKAFREESVESGFVRQSGRNFKISYPAGIPYALRATIMRILDGAYREIGYKFGKVYPPTPIQVVLYKAEQFSEATLLGAHVGAVFDGKIRAPITDADGAYLDDDELEERLTHEYVHVVVRFLAGANVPWWLNEGLAESFSGKMDESQENALARAYASKLNFSLSELEGSQLQKLSPEVLRLAYIQSQATVDHLYARGGQRRLSALMSDLATGKEPEAALRDHFRRTYASLEREVEGAYQ